jgi:putative FmdB family regulatory protein
MIYEFECDKCSTIFEVKASLSEKEKGLKPRCPKCNSENTHQIVTSFSTIGLSSDFSSHSSGGNSPCSSCTSNACGSCKH